MEAGPTPENYEAVAQPDLLAAFAEREVSIFGIQGTFQQLAQMCPVDLSSPSITLEAKNEFVIKAANEAGLTIEPEYEQVFTQITEQHGLERKFSVAPTQESAVPEPRHQSAQREVVVLDSTRDSAKDKELAAAYRDDRVADTVSETRLPAMTHHDWLRLIKGAGPEESRAPAEPSPITKDQSPSPVTVAPRRPEKKQKESIERVKHKKKHIQAEHHPKVDPTPPVRLSVASLPTLAVVKEKSTENTSNLPIAEMQDDLAVPIAETPEIEFSLTGEYQEGTEVSDVLVEPELIGSELAEPIAAVAIAEESSFLHIPEQIIEDFFEPEPAELIVDTANVDMPMSYDLLAEEEVKLLLQEIDVSTGFDYEYPDDEYVPVIAEPDVLNEEMFAAIEPDMLGDQITEYQTSLEDQAPIVLAPTESLELPAPVSEIEDALTAVFDAAESNDTVVADDIKRIVAKIIALPTELAATVEDRETANVADEVVAQALQELFIELFETAGIEYTEELVLAFVQLTRTYHFALFAERIFAEEDDNAIPAELGTREFLQKIKQTLVRLKRSAIHVYELGRSAMQLYRLSASFDNVYG